MLPKINHINFLVSKFQVMPPPPNLPAVVRNHIINHRIPSGTTLAVFVFYPPGLSAISCPIGDAIRHSADLHRRRYPRGLRRREQIFVNIWSIEGRYVEEALRSLYRHASANVWQNLETIILFYGHACINGFEFGEYLVRTRVIVQAVNSLSNVTCLGLLSCHSGALNLPPLSGYIAFGFLSLVDYDELSRFAIGLVSSYRISRMNHVRPRSAVYFAVHSSFTSLLRAEQVVIFA